MMIITAYTNSTNKFNKLLLLLFINEVARDFQRSYN